MRIALKILRVLLLLFLLGCNSEPIKNGVDVSEYEIVQTKLSDGWGTFNNNSLTSYVLLPDAFAVNLYFKEKGNYLKDVYKASAHKKLGMTVDVLHKAEDGSYGEIILHWRGNKVKLTNGSNRDDLYLLVEPIEIKRPEVFNFIVESAILWNYEGFLSKENQQLKFENGGKAIQVQTTGEVEDIKNIPLSAPYLAISSDKKFAVYTGSKKSIAEVEQILSESKEKLIARSQKYGELSEVFDAMQTVLATNVIFDPDNQRVIAPVSRVWSAGWGGYILFDWDTYFAAEMFSEFDKDLAYANAIEITNSITDNGFIPNFAAPLKQVSYDRSQPPVGSFTILRMYKKHQDKWLLEEVYDNLLIWNKWWVKERDNKGFLTWGSDSLSARPWNDKVQFSWKAALYESGLDNSPMYDGVPFNKEKELLEIADVGLISLYIADCNALIEMARLLGREADIVGIESRKEKYSQALQMLWNEDFGLYLNKHIDTGEWSYRLSPTLFYPLLTDVPSKEQADRMIAEHYFNEEEFDGDYVLPSIARNDPAFHDNKYWRGRIWAPQNYLVYLGLDRHGLEAAKVHLVEKSRKLLLKGWREDRSVYENYNSVTGVGNDVRKSDNFYHWGALLGYISILEGMEK